MKIFEVKHYGVVYWVAMLEWDVRVFNALPEVDESDTIGPDDIVEVTELDEAAQAARVIIDTTEEPPEQESLLTFVRAREVAAMGNPKPEILGCSEWD